MYQTVNRYEFADAFKKIRPENFSYLGLQALFDYLDGLEEDTGEKYELDVISICCDFTEYASAAEACAEISNLKKGEETDDEEHEKECLEWLQDNGTCIEIEGRGVIVSGH